MNSEEVINSKEYFRINRALQKKDSYAAMFSGMSDSLRMEWLRDENLIDRIDNEY